MPNVYVVLPMPALNGAGAAVDVSAMGGKKTVMSGGSFGSNFSGNASKPSITVQISADAGVSWAELHTFTTPEDLYETLTVCDRMRTFVRGRLAGDGFAAHVEVGGDPGAMTAALLPLPVLNGDGAAVDVTAMGTLRTFICGGTFAGAAILVEGSVDGGVTYAPVCQFTGRGGSKTMVDVSGFYRVTVTNRLTTVPFTGAMSVAGALEYLTTAALVVGNFTNVQSFTYVATGAEGTAFNVPIPVAQPDALYVPQYSLYDVVSHVTISFPVAGRTTLLLPVELSAALTLGDTIRFTVYNTP